MKEQIAALGMLVDPNASSEDKAAAAEKLAAYLNSQLDADEAKAKEAEAASAAGDEEKTTEKASETAETEEPSKEMASALATIQALTDRVSKIEKASAIGLRQRAPTKAPIIPREAPAPVDPHAAVTISIIEKAAQNTIGMLGK